MAKINSENLKFLPISKQDIWELAELYEDLTEKKSNIDKMKEIFPKINENPDCYLYKVEYEGILVGTIMGIICYELCADCQPFLVIEDVIVKKDFRRKNIGSFMFKELEKLAIKRGCYISILVSSYRHPEAHIFYEKIGFNDSVKGFRKKLNEQCF